MSMPGYRDRLKSNIVRVAREILVSDGLEGLQARRVARGADCSVGTIYNLFGNLDMVIITANADTLDELHGELLRSKDGMSTMDAQLNAMASMYLSFAVERTTEWRAIFEHRLTTKTTVPDWYLLKQSELFAVVEGILEQAIAAPNRRLEAARALFSAVHGVIALALDEKLGIFDRNATERQVKFIVQSISGGLRSPAND
jgi:AcrR family transcriptional regulator